MKKILLTAVSAAALAIPGVALASHDDGAAHQNREHQGAEHNRGQHRHGDARRAHDASSHNRREVRGTVASFANGVLTITRAGGANVSGKVNARTVLECPASASAASRGGSGKDDPAGHDVGDNNGVDPAGHDVGDDNGVDPAGHDAGDDNGVDPAGHDAGDDNGQDKAEHCTTAALVTGAIVREAKLSTSSADAVWLKIELAR
jgi:hypothetical protein